MGWAAKQPLFTTADYLLWEAKQAERHEDLDGDVFPLAGAEDTHVTVIGNLYMALRQHLTGSPCRTYLGTANTSVSTSPVPCGL